uniref:Uncharacterized protein n=1 Tax=Odontella aurita TaxID=265563 RepID=A0A7S4ING6_9STRA
MTVTTTEGGGAEGKSSGPGGGSAVTVEVTLDHGGGGVGGGVEEGCRSTEDDAASPPPSPPIFELIASVPEKLNLSCLLSVPGSVTIEGKLEGMDGFDISASDGDIRIKKLRGDNVKLHAGGGGIVYASDAIEGRTVDIAVDSGGSEVKGGQRGGRVRAKLINGSDVSIRAAASTFAGKDTPRATDRPSKFEPLDLDDALAIVDVSSLYSSRGGDGASLSVETPCGLPECPRAIRVKSTHGHVDVSAIAAGNAKDTLDEYGRSVPVVELGGVNGSCDAVVTQDAAGGAPVAAAKKTPAVAARVHVDSLSPDSVSVVASETDGTVGITVDRKVEADVRMVSTPNLGDLNVDALLGDGDAESIEKAASDVLSKHVQRWGRVWSSSTAGDPASVISVPGEEPELAAESKHDTGTRERIHVRTDAFEKETDVAIDRARFVGGTVTNRSREPDSRFDVLTKHSVSSSSDVGIGGGVNLAKGKINVEGAAAQALEGFSSGGGSSSSGSGGDAPRGPLRPLLAAASSGRIELETVSWFGAIARRYGMEERDGRSDLGRQASKSVKKKKSSPAGR